MAVSRNKKIIIGLGVLLVIGAIVAATVWGRRTDLPEVQVAKVEKRALLASGYARAITASFVDLFRVLAESDPIPHIRVVQKSVDDRVHDAINNGVWPYDPPNPPSAKIEPELKDMVAHLRTTFMPNWAPPPPGDRA